MLDATPAPPGRPTSTESERIAQTADWIWRHGDVRKKKSPNDTTARDAWWRSIGAEKRQHYRATYLSILKHSPNRGANPVADLAWWSARSTKQRVRMRDEWRDKWDRGIFDTVVGVAKKAGDIVTLGPIARQIPVVRDIHGAIQSIKNIPLDTAARVVRGDRLDRVAIGAFRQAVKSARTLAPYVQTVLATVPGLGTGLSGAIGASLALAQGLPITEVVLAAVRGSIPGGALAQAAFDVTAGLVQGKSLDQVALAALPVDASTKQALGRVAQAAKSLADGKRVDEVALSQLMQQLPPDARKAAQIATALTTAQRAQRTTARGNRTQQALGKQIAKRVPPPKKALTEAQKKNIRDQVAKVSRGLRVPKLSKPAAPKPDATVLALKAKLHKADVARAKAERQLKVEQAERRIESEIEKMFSVDASQILGTSFVPGTAADQIARQV